MQGMRDAWEQVKEMRGREEEAHQRAAFLAMAWKEGVHTDIVVKPGTGPPIPAHKAILVSGPSFPACVPFKRRRSPASPSSSVT